MTKIKNRRWWSTSFTLLAFLAADPALATGRRFPKRPCAPMLKTAEKPVAPTAISKADLSLSKFIPDAPVKDQGNYGCCWISSDLGEWERIAAKKFGHPVKLSENYMILASLFYRLEEAVYFGQEIFQGGWSETADWMATHIGLVPEEACKWKVDLRDEFVGDEIIAYLNGEVATFQATLDGMKKTALASGQPMDEAAAWTYADATKKKLLKYLRKRVGNFPSSFVVDGKKFTPNSFAKEFIEEQSEDWVRIQLSPTETRIDPPAGTTIEADILSEEKSLLGQFPNSWNRLPKAKQFFPDGKMPDKRMLRLFQLFGKSHIEEFAGKEIPMADIHKTIEEAIDAGQPVFLGTLMARDFYRNDSGIFSIAAMGRTVEEAKTAPIGGGHAVLITGLYKDPSGKLLGYKIHNSWGKDVGQNGYYQMDRDYFEVFMGDIVIHTRVPKKKPGTTSEAIEGLEKAKWDPKGKPTK